MNDLKIWYKTKLIKIGSWEYWPMWLVYIPAATYFIFLAIKARTFFFFSTANPSIETGGMFFESKWKIFKLIPKKYYPATILIDHDVAEDELYKKLADENISFPIIAKPDRGERGWMVKKIDTIHQLIAYKKSIGVDFLAQAYCDHPMEFSIFYYRIPGQEKGTVTSVTLKELLYVTGNGKSTVEELIHQNDRAFLQLLRLKKEDKISLSKILAEGEKEVLVPYGNHVLGAKFLDFNHIIDDQFINTMDRMSREIEGFYYGRYDLRCTSIEDLKAGKNIAVLELNGAGAEPSHIYQPGFSFWKAQKVIVQHYKYLYAAAIENKKRGATCMTYKDYTTQLKAQKKYKDAINKSSTKKYQPQESHPPQSAQLLHLFK